MSAGDNEEFERIQKCIARIKKSQKWARKLD
jgi:hypothetical protein